MSTSTFRILGHQWRKDLRRFARVGVLWLVSLGLVQVTSFYPPSSFDQDMRGLATAMYLAVMAIFAILTAILAAGVVLEDPPMGTTAFWLTRPLSRRLVAAEKLCFLAVLVAIPVLVDVAVGAFSGAAPQSLPFAMLEKILEYAPAFLALAGFAVIAESFGKWAVQGILILITSGIAMGIWLGVRAAWHGHVAAMGGTMLQSIRLAEEILVILLAAAIIVWRYRHRTARFTVAVVWMAAFAVMIFGSYWRWDFLSSRADVVLTAADASQAPALGVSCSWAAGGSARITAPTERDAKGEELIPWVAYGLALSWDSGGSSPMAGFAPFTEPPVDAMEPDQLARAVAPLNIVNLPRPDSFWASVALPPGAPQRLRRDQAQLTGYVAYFTGQLTIAGEIPLKAGTKLRVGRDTVEITDVTPPSADAEGWVTLQEGSFPSIFTREADGEVKLPNGRTYRRQWRDAYLVANRSRGEAMVAREGPGPESTTDRRGYRIHDHTLVLRHAGLDAAWMSGATLIVVRQEDAGYIGVPIRSVEIGTP